MSITKQHRQEYLSKAYIRAVAAKAGYTCAPPDPDYGLDLVIRDVDEEDDGNGKTVLQDYGYALDVSAKSTYIARIIDDCIHYDLEIKAYDNLIKEQRGTPAILVLYHMPIEETDWLSVGNDITILKHCGYWQSLRGKPPSTNSSTQVIEIPRSQVFCESSLKGIMNKVRSGEYL